MKNTQGASQEAFFVSRGFAKLSTVKPLSTFPPSAATVQQQYSIFSRGSFQMQHQEPPAKEVFILFFYPEAFSYICYLTN
jgi:hypothetical protein